MLGARTLSPSCRACAERSGSFALAPVPMVGASGLVGALPGRARLARGASRAPRPMPSEGPCASMACTDEPDAITSSDSPLRLQAK